MSHLMEKKAELFGSADSRRDGGCGRAGRNGGGGGIDKRNAVRDPATTKMGTAAEAVRASSKTTVQNNAARRAQNMKDAVGLRKKADDAMKKTWKKWNCDPFSAAPLYDKAGALFRACGDDEKGAEAFLDGADCHLTNKNFILAAKSYKEAAQTMVSQGKALAACDAFKSSAQAWMNAGEEGKAGEYLMQAAKQLEDENEGDAANLYVEAVCTLVPDEAAVGDDMIRVLGAREVFDEATRFLIQLERYEQALNVIERHELFLRSEGANHSLHKLFVSCTIVMLVMGDFVRADKAYKDEHLQDTAYLTTPECALEDELLVVYRNYDEEGLDTLKSDNRFSRLQPYIARLGMTLQIDEEGERQLPRAPAVNVIDEEDGGQPPHAAPTNAVVDLATTNSSNEIPTLEGIRARVEQLRVKGDDKEMKIGRGGDDSSKGADADSVEVSENTNTDIDKAVVIGARTENNEAAAAAPCPPISKADPGDDHDSSEEEFDLT